MLCGLRVMLQAAGFDGLTFDPFSFAQNGVAAAKIDVGGREIVEAFVIAAVVVVVDESRDLALQLAT